MRLAAWRILREFGAKHPETRPSFDRFRAIITAGEWTTISDLNASFSGAKPCAPNRLRFEIAGGDYRLIVAFDLRRQIAFVKFVGTHDEYDAIDAATVSLY